MAFVPNYKHDIFVSYAHVDDEPFPGADKGWVTTLLSAKAPATATRIRFGFPDTLQVKDIQVYC